MLRYSELPAQLCHLLYCELIVVLFQTQSSYNNQVTEGNSFPFVVHVTKCALSLLLWATRGGNKKGKEKFLNVSKKYTNFLEQRTNPQTISYLIFYNGNLTITNLFDAKFWSSFFIVTAFVNVHLTCTRYP